MAESYPTSLSTCILKGSFIGVPIDSVLVSGIDGFPQTRNRHTTSYDTVKWKIRMNHNDLYILMNWYNNTLKRVLSFNFVDPITSNILEYSFLTPPVYSHLGGDNFVVDFNLETV